MKTVQMPEIGDQVRLINPHHEGLENVVATVTEIFTNTQIEMKVEGFPYQHLYHREHRPFPEMAYWEELL